MDNNQDVNFFSDLLRPLKPINPSNILFLLDKTTDEQMLPRKNYLDEMSSKKNYLDEILIPSKLLKFNLKDSYKDEESDNYSFYSEIAPKIEHEIPEKKSVFKITKKKKKKKSANMQMQKLKMPKTPLRLLQKPRILQSKLQMPRLPKQKKIRKSPKFSNRKNKNNLQKSLREKKRQNFTDQKF